MWAGIEEFEDYAISSHGRVKNLRFDRILTPRSNGYGYKKVGLRRGGQTYELLVHRLVAAAFMSGYTPYVKIRHRGENGDNHVNNLFFASEKRVGHLIRDHAPIRPRRVRIIETGEVFRGAQAVAERIGSHRSAVHTVLRGERKSHRGYSFEYFNEGD